MCMCMCMCMCMYMYMYIYIYIYIYITNTLNKLGEKRMRQDTYYNRNAKDLPSLKKGDVVCIKPAKYNKHWQKATVQRQVNVRSYEVETDYGSVFRRNRRHLRKTTAPPAVPVIEPQIGLPPEAEAHALPVRQVLRQFDGASHSRTRSPLLLQLRQLVFWLAFYFL